MGASRKLQGEIDRVLKKPEEGVDVFDSIWNKVPLLFPFSPTPDSQDFARFPHGSPAAGLRHRECQQEGEVRGRPQEGDQEAAALLGPDQDLDSVQ